MRVVLTVLLAAVFGFFGLIILIIIALSGVKAIYINLGALLYIEIFLAFAITIWNTDLVKQIRKWLLGVAGVIIITGLACYGYDLYIDSIPTVNEQGVDLSKYQPFGAGSLVAVLPEASTLKLDHDLPRLDCATALYPVMASFVQAVYPPDDYWTKTHEDSPVKVTTTVGAYDNLITGQVDMILVAAPSEQQIAKAKEVGVELRFTPIGREGFVFFVNGKNPVDNLSLEQIRGIYSGRITNWKQVGGKEVSIRAFQRPDDSGSQSALQRLMEGEKLQIPPKEDVISGMGGIITEVSSYKNYNNALGFSFRYFATEMVNDQQIRLLKIEGVYPDKDTIRKGEYPLSSNFYAVTTGQSNPNTQVLLDWILSPQGQYLIEASGYVSIK